MEAAWKIEYTGGLAQSGCRPVGVRDGPPHAAESQIAGQGRAEASKADDQYISISIFLSILHH